jgi:hypothetical protein
MWVTFVRNFQNSAQNLVTMIKHVLVSAEVEARFQALMTRRGTVQPPKPAEGRTDFFEIKFYEFISDQFANCSSENL